VVVEANCNAHGRRHVVDEAGNFPAECRQVLEALVINANYSCRQK